MPIEMPFKIVANACEKTGTSVILIGGQALGVHGYQRVTLDVDFMITEGDYEKLRSVICAAGYREVVRTDVAAKLCARSDDLVDIDFMFVNKSTYDGVKKDSKEEKYKECGLLVPKLTHLIALKLHAIKQQPEVRELKDLNDIVELIKANKLDVRTDEFRTLCRNFGTDALYKKILKYTKTDG